MCGLDRPSPICEYAPQSGKISRVVTLSPTAISPAIGAVLIVAAGLIAAFFCVRAERKPLEAVARPLIFVD